jgi:hypothetical protein
VSALEFDETLNELCKYGLTSINAGHDSLPFRLWPPGKVYIG